MKPNREDRYRLQQFRDVLFEADAPHLLAPSGLEANRSDDARVPPAQITEDHRSIACLFRFGEAVERATIERIFPPDIVAALERLGLLQQDGTRLNTGEFRLVYHMGVFLFCHKISAYAKFYYGTDSLALSRVLLPVPGRVLDLCAGVGAQSLVCARTASSVAAVEIEASAELVFWINAAMNGLTDKLEFLSGDLFDPVSGRQFDHICCNPPFLPVPPEIRFPRYAAGGLDGLAMVRRLLQRLPEFLAPEGTCQIIGSALGSYQGPDLSSLGDLAMAANLDIQVSCYTYEELDERTLALFAATAVDCAGGGDARETYRAHFTRLGVSHLYYFVLRARHHQTPSGF